MTSSALAVAGLSVRYGKAPAVRKVDLELAGGGLTALVGPNGAGKSSLLNGIMGVRPHTVRQLTVFGEDITRMRANHRARRGLVLVPQGRVCFPRLSVYDNLKVVADGLQLKADTIERSLDRFPVLRQRLKSRAGVLSGGERQMLALARALLSDPRVLLLDEPTLGLAPAVVQQLHEVIEQLRTEGTSIVVAEPTIRLLPPSIDRGMVMLDGRLTASASGIDALQCVYSEQFQGV